MSRRVEGENRAQGGNRIAAFLFSVLPAAAVLGLMAPDVIETQLVAAQSVVMPLSNERVAWQPRHFKTPLLVPSAILIDHGLDLVDVNALLERFAHALGAGRPELKGVKVSELPGFEGPDGDTIVYEDDEFEPEEFFEHSLELGLSVNLSPTIPDFARVIPGDRDAFGAEGGFTLFDDFVSEQLHPNAPKVAKVPLDPIPEPGTGTLLGMGLILLTQATRRTRR